MRLSIIVAILAFPTITLATELVSQDKPTTFDELDTWILRASIGKIERNDVLFNKIYEERRTICSQPDDLPDHEVTENVIICTMKISSALRATESLIKRDEYLVLLQKFTAAMLVSYAVESKRIRQHIDSLPETSTMKASSEKWKDSIVKLIGTQVTVKRSKHIPDNAKKTMASDAKEFEEGILYLLDDERKAIAKQYLSDIYD